MRMLAAEVRRRVEEARQRSSRRRGRVLPGEIPYSNGWMVTHIKGDEWRFLWIPHDLTNSYKLQHIFIWYVHAACIFTDGIRHEDVKIVCSIFDLPNNFLTLALLTRRCLTWSFTLRGGWKKKVTGFSRKVDGPWWTMMDQSRDSLSWMQVMKLHLAQLHPN